MTLMCPHGTITRILDDHPKAVGINLEKQIKEFGAVCRVNEKSYQNSKCSSAVKLASIESLFEKQCVGKSECLINMHRE